MAEGDRAWPAVVTPHIRSVLSAAFDAGYFAAIAKVDPPVSWTVTRFYEELTSPNSG
jgi:hypothetical protein